MSIKQRFILAVTTLFVVLGCIFLIWYIETPKETMEGTLVYQTGVQYVG